MIRISSSDQILNSLNIRAVAAYLKSKGWNRIEHPNDHWLVFHGPLDDSGKPVEVILPSSDNFQDSQARIADVVNVLAAIENALPHDIVKLIRARDRDILKIRVLNALGDNNLVPLQLAETQVSNLMQLLVYSASSEVEQRPYFPRGLKRGYQYVRDCRFGHTFYGSFGYTIESPIVPSLTSGMLPEIKPHPPFERRVIERVIRGLLATQRAVDEDNLEAITREYSTGLNANMCRALIEVSHNKNVDIEYSVLWSPLQEPDEKLRNLGAVCLKHKAYQYLERAANELESEPPRDVVLRGKITQLRSDDPTETSESLRTVVITSTDQLGNPINVRVPLSYEDYRLACEAHPKGRSITVKGMLEKKGNRWKLYNPCDFQVDWSDNLSFL